MISFRCFQLFHLLTLFIIWEAWYWRIGPRASYPLASYSFILSMGVPTYLLIHVVAAKDMNHLGFLYRRFLPGYWLRLVTDKKFAFAEYRVREALNWMPEVDVIGYDWFQMSFEKIEGGDISISLTNVSRPLVMAALGTNNTSTTAQNVEAFLSSNKTRLLSAADGQEIYWRMIDLFYTGTRYRELAKNLIQCLPLQQHIKSAHHWLLKVPLNSRYKELAKDVLPYLPSQQYVESAAHWLLRDSSYRRNAVKLVLFVQLPFSYFEPAINDDVVLQDPDDYARMLGCVQRLFRRVVRRVV
ncbi:hypothetical protein BCR37DRAFT_385339 [Protomyces lactucae-debilis]|uniref:Uncharacterized protein n=1 Tax=Protomyces lactucae-debilis TaxID=2754530 RepID=A0A1Y2FUL0_PROLT|nr:uncharacterized protein BCR37DRAFT_385339 [Protomyces lactucae-debilis]ORY86876.1 hypothetical protein BCR37DRAFT_385339 [Protomyces lactucae-debilis]